MKITPEAGAIRVTAHLEPQFNARINPSPLTLKATIELDDLGADTTPRYMINLRYPSWHFAIESWINHIKDIAEPGDYILRIGDKTIASITL